MKLEELTTDELMNIEGGGLGNFFYDVCYATLTSFRFASNLSNSLDGNSNYGNAMIYK